MSGPPIVDMYAQAFPLSAVHAITVKDQYRTSPSGTVININPSHESWFKIFLAPTTDATASDALTEDTAKDLLRHINAKINDGLASTCWEFSLLSNTLVQIKYVGTGLGSITWGSTTLRSLLGYNTNVSPPLSTNSVAWGAFPPTHCWFSSGRSRDTGWIEAAEQTAGARLPSGKVYGWNAPNQGFLRRLTTEYHPYDHTVKVSAEIDSLSTPMFPDKTRWASLSTAVDVAPPWSVVEDLKSKFRRLSVTIGNFQTLIAGTSTLYDECQWHPEMFAMEDQPQRVDPNWNALWNRDLVLSWIAQGQR